MPTGDSDTYTNGSNYVDTGDAWESGTLTWYAPCSNDSRVRALEERLAQAEARIAKLERRLNKRKKR